MKKIFLVDIENVGKKFSKGAEQLSSNDIVYIFKHELYGLAADNKHIEDIKKTGATVVVKESKGTHAKNSVDFHISTQLGFEISKNKESEESICYYIVTSDKGLKATAEYAKTLLVNSESKQEIKIIDFIGKCFNSSNKKQYDGILVKNKIETLLKNNYNSSTINCAYAGIKLTKSLRDYHTFLQKNLTEKEEAKNIYKLIKPVYKEYIAA